MYSTKGGAPNVLSLHFFDDIVQAGIIRTNNKITFGILKQVAWTI